jgi:hypothetical protein
LIFNFATRHRQHPDVVASAALQQKEAVNDADETGGARHFLKHV